MWNRALKYLETTCRAMFNLHAGLKRNRSCELATSTTPNMVSKAYHPLRCYATLVLHT